MASLRRGYRINADAVMKLQGRKLVWGTVGGVEH